MAIEAGNGHMPAGQGEAGLVVPAQRERRGRIVFDCMAFLAAAVVRRPREMAFVDIHVAIQTLAVLDVIIRSLPGGDMALGAGNGRVLPFQRVAAGGVLGRAKSRCLEALDRVAGLAGAAVLARAELPVVRIRRVAVRAFPMRQRNIERHAMVTGAALHIGMFAQQRILAAGVIEDRAHSRPRYLLPHRDIVAGIAVGLEAAAVRIRVARRTLVEGQANIFGDLRFTTRWLVTLHAGYPQVRPDQREFGFRMVKSCGTLPLHQRVTFQTVSSQLAAMRVGVAGEAIARQTQESAVEVPAFD